MSTRKIQGGESKKKMSEREILSQSKEMDSGQNRAMEANSASKKSCTRLRREKIAWTSKVWGRKQDNNQFEWPFPKTVAALSISSDINRTEGRFGWKRLKFRCPTTKKNQEARVQPTKAHTDKVLGGGVISRWMGKAESPASGIMEAQERKIIHRSLTRISSRTPEKDGVQIKGGEAQENLPIVLWRKRNKCCGKYVQCQGGGGQN